MSVTGKKIFTPHRVRRTPRSPTRRERLEPGETIPTTTVTTVTTTTETDPQGAPVLVEQTEDRRRESRDVVYIDRTLPFRQRPYTPSGLVGGFDYMERKNVSEKLKDFWVTNHAPGSQSNDPTGAFWHKSGPLVIEAGVSNDERTSNRIYNHLLEARFCVKTNVLAGNRGNSYRARVVVVLDRNCRIQTTSPSNCIFRSLSDQTVDPTTQWKDSIDSFIHRDWHDSLEVLYDHVYMSEDVYVYACPNVFGALSLPLGFNTFFSNSNNPTRNAIYAFYMFDPTLAVLTNDAGSQGFLLWKEMWYYDLRIRLWYSDAEPARAITIRKYTDGTTETIESDKHTPTITSTLDATSVLELNRQARERRDRREKERRRPFRYHYALGERPYIRHSRPPVGVGGKTPY